MKNIYRELPNHLNKIFEPRVLPKIKDVSLANLEPLLNETFTTTIIHLERRGPDGNHIQVSIKMNK